MDAVTELLAASHFADPGVLPIAVLAVLLVGLSKGGLGGAFGLMGVPILSLTMPPVQAAALFLPILLVMDWVGLWTWRGTYHAPTLRAMLPAALVGIGIGALTAAVTPEALVRLIVGLIAVGFATYSAWPQRGPQAEPSRNPGAAKPEARTRSAWIWGTATGFTSFVAHAGGPPFQVHTLPLRLDPKVYTGTAVVFFAVVNAVKVVPYAALGQFDARTLLSAATMIPVAVVAVRLGAAAVRRMRPQVFYPFMIAMVALVGLRLVYDGLVGLFGAG